MPSKHPVPVLWHQNATMKNPDEKTQPPQAHTAAETEEKKEKGLDQTIEDTFPASDPPSSIPDPEDETTAA